MNFQRLKRLRQRQAELPAIQAKPHPPRLPHRQDEDLEAEYEEADRIDYIVAHVERLRQEGKQGKLSEFILPD